MEKKDLSGGNYVILRDGSKCIVQETNKILVDVEDGTYINLDSLNENLTCKSNNSLDIIKVYSDYTLRDLLYKRKTPKLKVNKEERR